MNTRIISFHNGNLLPELIEYQKKVFDFFGMPLEQIQTELSHAAAIDKWLNEEDWDMVMIFDTDCVPLQKEFMFNNPFINFIVGNAQRSSHIVGSKDFAAPSFISFSKELFFF